MITIIDNLPSFIIPGAQKSGTTSLHYYLSQHQDVFMPEGKRQETHFFDTEENYRQGIEWYKNCFIAKSEGQVIGETSPLYMYLEHVPERIYQLLPDVKFIFILRNPVDRAYSHYWHEWKKNREHLSFEAAIQKEDDRINIDFWHLRNFSYLSRGKYIDQIETFLKFFSLDQMLFVLYEEFKEAPTDYVKQCFKFLGVHVEITIDVLQKHNITILPRNRFIRKILKNRFTKNVAILERINEKYNTKVGYPPMNMETREELIKYFSPQNKRLEKLLNHNLDIWDQ